MSVGLNRLLPVPVKTEIASAAERSLPPDIQPHCAAALCNADRLELPFGPRLRSTPLLFGGLPAPLAPLLPLGPLSLPSRPRAGDDEAVMSLIQLRRFV